MLCLSVASVSASGTEIRLAQLESQANWLFRLERCSETFVEFHANEFTGADVPLSWGDVRQSVTDLFIIAAGEILFEPDVKDDEEVAAAHFAHF